MHLRTLFSAVLALGVLIAAPVAQTTYLPLDQVRPGMVGVGRTVFSGSKLEDFKVEVLGCDAQCHRTEAQPDPRAPRRRSPGQDRRDRRHERQPVYVDGKLMGAVSYSLGQFSTEPIAGITPIDEMLDATMMTACAARVASRSACRSSRRRANCSRSGRAISADRSPSSTNRPRRWSCPARHPI
jgi:hypothetical protein